MLAAVLLLLALGTTLVSCAAVRVPDPPAPAASTVPAAQEGRLEAALVGLFVMPASVTLRYDGGRLLGQATIVPGGERELRVFWQLVETDAEPGSWVERVYALDGRPTALCFAASDTLGLATRAPDGRAVIETWRFAAPAVRPAPLRQPGEWRRPRPEVVPAEPTRTVVPTAAVTEREAVIALGRWPGADRAALVAHLHDSGELWRLDLAGETAPVRLASPAPAPPAGVFAEPRLDFVYDYLDGGDHRVHGWIWIFVDELGRSPGGASLVLMDSDRDGTIDDSVVLSGDRWSAMGLGDATLYVEHGDGAERDEADLERDGSGDGSHRGERRR